MKYTRLVFLVFIIAVQQSYGQYTERYIELVKSVKPTDSSQYEYKYKDGSVKEKGKKLYYKIPEYTYSKKTGKITQYHKNGIVKSIQKFDKYGNMLVKEYYNDDGSLWHSRETIKIDSNLKDPKKYFYEGDHVIFTLYIKNYKFGKNIGKMYLREEGQTKNNKKVGLWRTYTQRGELEEEIIHN